MRLEGRTAVVTGGSRGIGAAACRAFAREGADVLLTYASRGAEAEAIAAEIEGMGRRAVALQGDVSDEADVARLADTVAEFVGGTGLNVLFNNAGIYPGGDIRTVSIEDWDRVIAVNVRGPFLCVRALLPLLERAESPRIINIGSVIPGLGIPGTIHYAAAKAAVGGFTRSLSRELADAGINVNCVVPSMVETETTQRLYAGVEGPIVESQSVQRYQQPEDLQGALVFLASDESEFMTGQTVVVDGGRLLQ